MEEDLEMYRNHLVRLYPDKALEMGEKWGIVQLIGSEHFSKDNYNNYGMIFCILNFLRTFTEKIHEKYRSPPF